MKPVDLIKSFEGLELTAYQDTNGTWTIGYGTTAKAGVGITPRQGMTITEAEAEYYLEKMITKLEQIILPKIAAPMNENEKAVFLSLAYNIGPGNFLKSSALRKFNAGDKPGAADAILLWNKETINGKRVVNRGLVNRRNKEREIFLQKDAGGVAFPPVVQLTPPPIMDQHKAEILALQSALLDLGYDPGPLDGLTGPRTRAAATAFGAGRR